MTILTPPPTAPNRADPATFPDRADAYVAWWATVAAEINNVVEALGSGGRTTVAGTANALTVTTAIGYTSTIPIGTTLTIIPTANNTGAATINIDGLGNENLRTLRDTALPADYLLSGVPVQIVKTSTGWVVLRQPDNGYSAGNGQWTRFGDGTIIQSHGLTISSGGTITWTFPKAVQSSPPAIVTAVAVVSTDDRNITVANLTTTTVDLYGWTTAGAAWNGTLRAKVEGRWF